MSLSFEISSTSKLNQAFKTATIPTHGVKEKKKQTYASSRFAPEYIENHVTNIASRLKDCSLIRTYQIQPDRWDVFKNIIVQILPSQIRPIWQQSGKIFPLIHQHPVVPQQSIFDLNDSETTTSKTSLKRRYFKIHPELEADIGKISQLGAFIRDEASSNWNLFIDTLDSLVKNIFKFTHSGASDGESKLQEDFHMHMAVRLQLALLTVIVFENSQARCERGHTDANIGHTAPKMEALHHALAPGIRIQDLQRYRSQQLSSLNFTQLAQQVREYLNHSTEISPTSELKQLDLFCSLVSQGFDAKELLDTWLDKDSDITTLSSISNLRVPPSSLLWHLLQTTYMGPGRFNHMDSVFEKDFKKDLEADLSTSCFHQVCMGTLSIESYIEDLAQKLENNLVIILRHYASETLPLGQINQKLKESLPIADQLHFDLELALKLKLEELALPWGRRTHLTMPNHEEMKEGSSQLLDKIRKSLLLMSKTNKSYSLFSISKLQTLERDAFFLYQNLRARGAWNNDNVALLRTWIDVSTRFRAYLEESVKLISLDDNPDIHTACAAIPYGISGTFKAAVEPLLISYRHLSESEKLYLRHLLSAPIFPNPFNLVLGSSIELNISQDQNLSLDEPTASSIQETDSSILSPIKDSSLASLDFDTSLNLSSCSQEGYTTTENYSSDEGCDTSFSLDESLLDDILL